MSGGITLDAGGLIAIDRKDRRVLALIAEAKERKMRITVPATALAQAMRNPTRQAMLSRLIRQPGTDLVALDGVDATSVGILLARTGTSDITDAHVVVCAQRSNQAIITSDPDDIRRLTDSVRVEAI